MRVLVVTAMYPTAERPAWGIFVQEQVDSLRKSGVDVDVLAFGTSGGTRAQGYLEAARALRRELGRDRYDLVHAHYGLSGAVARMQTRCPVVVTFHGSDLMGEVGPRRGYTLQGEVKAIVSKLVALGVDQRIVVADSLKAALWLRSAVTIPMGVDLALFRPMPTAEARERLQFSNDRQRVLFAAHPDNYAKRFDIAQQAVELLQADSRRVELVPLRNVPHDQVPVYMNACDVLVLTSMHEGSPCVIKEAMACNLPIVSVDVGDVAQRIGAAEGCYLCERTPGDVAAKLERVLEDGRRPDTRTRIAELSLQNVARRVITVYEEVLRTRS